MGISPEQHPPAPPEVRTLVVGVVADDSETEQLLNLGGDNEVEGPV